MRKSKGLTVVTRKNDSMTPFYNVLKAQEDRHQKELRRQERLYGKRNKDEQG